MKKTINRIYTMIIICLTIIAGFTCLNKEISANEKNMIM